MKAQPRLVHWLVWGLLGLVVLSVLGVFVSTLRAPKAQPIPVLGQLPDFQLTNQLNQVVSSEALRGNIWVADIIFTRCPGPCWQMTGRMKTIQDRLPRNSPVKLVSITADPEFDTPSVLNTYAARVQADPKNWHFLTGPKQEIYHLATKGLKLAVEENTDRKPDEDLFIHSTRLMLVDKQGRLRGVSFDGTEAQAVPEILRAIDQLLREDD